MNQYEQQLNSVTVFYAEPQYQNVIIVHSLVSELKHKAIQINITSCICTNYMHIIQIMHYTSVY
jgi:hypothetical protein